MNIFITGGSGFIGRHLCHELHQQGHNLTLLSRRSAPPSSPHRFIQSLDDIADFSQFDAVINLAGEPIFDRYWTAVQKARLLHSRLDLTEQLAQKIRTADKPPHTFISASASGYYGDIFCNQQADESYASGKHFAANLCRQWEEKAQLAQKHSRLCIIRTGLVLDKRGGMLARILPLYRFALGGKLGNGKQHWAWISLSDQINAILFLLNNPHCQGAFNLVSPNGITQAEFNRLLARKLKRPAFCHAPKQLLKLLLGERAQLLLDNQAIAPSALLNAGFQFQHTDLGSYFEEILP